jgi:hypothetical protein
LNKFFTTVLTLASLAIALPAYAGGCEITTSAPELTIPETAAGPAHYVDNDACQPGCGFSIWIYEESNGMDGLQRGDEVVDDTCGLIDSDTILV